MPSRDVERLAIDGGPKAITSEIPSVSHGLYEIGEEEKQNVLDVLERKALFRWSNAQDSYVMKFERDFARKVGAKHALAVCSGTSALVTGLTALGVGPGDEVIVPGYTFIASASAVLLAGAVPVIAEIDDTLTIDPLDVERKITPQTKAIMPVHMRGIPSQMDAIMHLAECHNLLVIEDAAQANGGSYKGQRLGSIGDVGCFSMQVSKTMTTGEGGVVVTDHDPIYARAALSHDSASIFWRRLSEDLSEGIGDVRPFPGNGYRMGELAGAVGCAQLKKLDRMIRTMRQRKQEILAEIDGAPGLRPMRVPDPEGDCALSLNFLFENAEESRHFARALAAEGVRVGTIHNEGFPDRHIYRYWDYVLNKLPVTPTNDPWRHPAYIGKVEYSPDMCPNTISYLTRTVSVSFNQRMTARHSKMIARAILKVADGLYG
jgi:8-amino-3,8-dideoxy-alpha-D-manno-octulosonate transaminase